MQVNPAKYRNIWSGLGVILREQGPAGLWKGWGGKLFGYGVQGGCRFGLYEYFKKFYCDAAGPDNVIAQFVAWAKPNPIHGSVTTTGTTTSTYPLSP
jgi:hypothetical protein